MIEHKKLLFVGGKSNGVVREVPDDWNHCKLPVHTPKRVRDYSHLESIASETFEVESYSRERVMLPGPQNENGMRWYLEVEVMTHDELMHKLRVVV